MRIETLWNYYGKLPLSTKLHLYLRFISTPFYQIEKLLPEKGTFLDIGCGHGLFDLILVLKSSKRKIVGIDPDKNKIILAQKLTRRIPNIIFRRKFLHKSLFSNRFDVIMFIDVLYLLPWKEKVRILKEAKKLLKQQGIIVVKTNNASKSLNFILCYLQEFISVLLLKFTFSKKRGLFFQSLSEYKKLFRLCNIRIIKSITLETPIYHPHHLFILHK